MEEGGDYGRTLLLCRSNKLDDTASDLVVASYSSTNTNTNSKHEDQDQSRSRLSLTTKQVRISSDISLSLDIRNKFSSGDVYKDDGGRKEYFLMGSGCGLCCLFRPIFHPLGKDCGPPYAERIVLWDPTLNRTLTLPHDSYDYFNYGRSSPPPLLLGVGFSSNDSDSDVKVVRAARFFSAGDTVFQTSVYSLSSRAWRSFHCSVPHYIESIVTPQGVHCNGMIHWVIAISTYYNFNSTSSSNNTVALDDDDDDDDQEYYNHKLCILSFSLANETFSQQLVYLPEGFRNCGLDCYIMSFQSLKEGELSLFVRHNNTVNREFVSCSLWVMMVNDFSWAKLFTVGDYDHVITNFVDIAPNGQIVLNIGIGNWVVYDPKTGTYSRVPHTEQLSTFVCPLQPKSTLTPAQKHLMDQLWVETPCWKQATEA